MANMKTPTTALLLTLTLVLANAAAASEIYKWVDEDGNAQYGDRPTEGAIRLTSLESRPTDYNQVQQSVDARYEREKAADDAAEERATERRSKEESVAQAEERAGQCQTFRGRLEKMVMSRRLYREDENGERDYLNEDEMQSARDRVQSQIEEYCSS
jgi:hypothetical protein